MSTLKSINVVHPSGAINNITNDASGNVAVGNNLTVAGAAAITGALSAGGTAVVAAAPTAAGNIPFSTNGTTWSSTAKIVQSTAATLTTQASVDFINIPSWAKRITVMFNGVSAAAASSLVIVQVGSGSISTSGYISQLWGGTALGTAGEGMFALSTGNGSAGYNVTGQMIISLFGSNTWISTTVAGYENVVSTGGYAFGRSPALSGALDRIRVTFYSGTSSTFDAGSINILYE